MFFYVFLIKFYVDIMIKKLLSALLFLCSFSIFAQLDDFSLQVGVTPQTCYGNGVLTFTVTNTTHGAYMDYTNYLFLDTTVPIATITATTLTGLLAGDYLIVATQSLGGSTGVQQEQVTIANLIVPLTYVANSSIICPNDGTITVNVTSGNAVSYEIFSGPVTFPLQASNVR